MQHSLWRHALPDILGRSLSNIVLKTAQACAVDRSPAGGSDASHSASVVPIWRMACFAYCICEKAKGGVLIFWTFIRVSHVFAWR